MALQDNYFNTGNYDSDVTTGRDLGLQDNFDEIWFPVIQSVFEEEDTLAPVYTKRTIGTGSSLKVPVMGEASVSFIPAGGETPEEDINHGSVIIQVTNRLSGSVSITDEDKMTISYEYLSTKVKNVAIQMAKLHNSSITANLVLAARGTRNAGDTNVVAGNTANPTLTIAGWASLTSEEKAKALYAQLLKANEILDINDVKMERYFVCNPSIYWILFNNLDTLNRDFGGVGSISEGNLPKIAGITIIKSNAYGRNPTDLNGDYFYTVDYGNSGIDLSFGVVTTDEAVVCVEKMNLTTEKDRIPSKQKDIYYMNKIAGYGILRNDVAVEITEAV